jgi:hypothetical protein
MVQLQNALNRYRTGLKPEREMNQNHDLIILGGTSENPPAGERSAPPKQTPEV